MLEGGSIDVNGAGLLLTTEECLLSETVQVRNPGLGRADLERYFADYLGITRTIWLKRGIAGDDTHGHIDDLARFVDENTIVTVTELDKSDANYEPLQENLELLQQTGLRIATLPMPAPVYFDGQRLPASYANFYIANKLVLVPTFNDPMDRVALTKLAALFPDREVVGIHCLRPGAGPGNVALHDHAAARAAVNRDSSFRTATVRERWTSPVDGARRQGCRAKFLILGATTRKRYLKRRLTSSGLIGSGYVPNQTTLPYGRGSVAPSDRARHAIIRFLMRFLDWATIAVYLLAITWFGARFRKSQRSLKDYFLGGHRRALVGHRAVHCFG